MQIRARRTHARLQRLLHCRFHLLEGGGQIPNHHFFRQYVEEGFFHVHYVKSNLNVADYLTKPSHGELFARLTKSAMEA